MAELADALDLGSSAREGVGVQVSPGARRISEMRTRFSDLVFSYWGNSAATAAASRVVYGRPTCAPPTSLTSRVVCGGSHLSTLALPCSHLRLNPPVHAGAALAPCLPALRRSRQPPRRSASQPLFHHTVSKRPDHQLHAIMCSRLCHGGR